MVAANGIQAIFFDFDGVLAESADIKLLAFDDLYADHDKSVRDFALAHHAANAGISRLEKIRHIHKTQLGIDLTDAEIAEWGGRYNALVEQAVIDAPEVPGATAFLEAHCDDLPLYVVSGTPEDELRRIVAARGMTRYFAGVYGSPRHKGPIVTGLLAERGFAQDRVRFVGDSSTDYDGAEEAGVPFIGRVPPGEENPFPAGTPLIGDLTELDAALSV